MIDLHPHTAFEAVEIELPDWMRGTCEKDFEPFPSVLREISGHDLEEMAAIGDED